MDTRMEALNRRKEAKSRWLNDHDNIEKKETRIYKKCQKKASNISDMKTYKKNLLEEMKGKHERNRPDSFYQMINFIGNV